LLASDGLFKVELIVVAVGRLLWVSLVVGGVLFNSALFVGVVG
jgi:hypothetical protein